MERYTVISADGHAGGAIADYRPYLPSALARAVRRVADHLRQPVRGPRGRRGRPQLGLGPSPGRARGRRRRRRGRVPEHDPALLPKSSLVHQPPAANDGDLELRWEGLRAHNRWLADFCADVPGRRAGIAQILLHDVDAAVAEVRWAAGRPHRRRAPPRHPTGLGPPSALRTRLRAAVGRVRGARPRRSTTTPAARRPTTATTPKRKVMFLVEATWWAHRALWQLIYGGRDGAPPDAAVRVHRAGHRVAARAARDPRRLRGPHGAARPARRSTSSAST